MAESSGCVTLPLNTRAKLPPTGYSTSTGVGHQHIYPIPLSHQRLDKPLPVGLLTRDREVLVDTYKTTTGTTHNAKERTCGPQYAALPSNNQAVEYQRSIHEKFQQMPVKTMRTFATEYTSAYKPIEPITSADTAPAGFYNYKVEYEIPRCGKQLAIPPDRKSIASQLDPYISTTHLTHGMFDPEDLEGIADRDNITFWNHADDSPLAKKKPSEMLMLLRKEPVYDHSVFKTPAFNRIVPRLVPHVPHKGLQSEVQAQFQLPASDAASHNVTSCFPAVMRASSGEVLSIPAMYSTEYSHLGTDRPLTAVIEQAH